MILWIAELTASALIQNSKVEFYHKKAFVKINAEKIEKKNAQIEAETVEADVELKLMKNGEHVFIKAKKLIFDPKDFECQALDNIQLNWTDLVVYASRIVFQIQEYIAHSNTECTAHYKGWTFKVPQLFYRHMKRVLECQKGCEIFNQDTYLKAYYGIAELEKWFRLSKQVWFKNAELELESDEVVCLLDKSHRIVKVTAPFNTDVKTKGGILLKGKDIVYEHDKVLIQKNAHCVVPSAMVNF